MLDLQFDLPEADEKGRYVITEKMVKGLEPLVKLPLSTEEAPPPAPATPAVAPAAALAQDKKSA